MIITLKWGAYDLSTIKYPLFPNSIFFKSTSSIDISKWPQVPNCTKCYIGYYPKTKAWKKLSFSNDYVDTSVKRVAVIVESPHKNEFDAAFNPLQPLNGKSGNNFENKILSKMNAWFPDPVPSFQVFEIRVFNPVQYQTSLYHYLNDMIPTQSVSKDLKPGYSLPQYGSLGRKENKELRNQVWRVIYNKAITRCKANFCSELVAYSPDYIINTCTGCRRKGLNSFVRIKDISSMPCKKYTSLKTIIRYTITTRIRPYLANIEYLEDCHPCVW